MQEEDCLALFAMSQTSGGKKAGYGAHRLPEKQPTVMHVKHVISWRMVEKMVVT